MPSLAEKIETRSSSIGPKADGTYWVSFRPAVAECIVQCLSLEHEVHQTASKLCTLGFEPARVISDCWRSAPDSAV
jgi:hypothetical protein